MVILLPVVTQLERYLELLRFKERDVLPGDYKYEDWNGDGEINGQDEHPFAFDQTPWLQFSLNAGLQWKNLDFNMLLQGSALVLWSTKSLCMKFGVRTVAVH